MKIAYFDAFSGISGDMVIGALLDAGLPISHLRKEFKKLDISGYTLIAKKVKQSSISATAFEVKVTAKQKNRNFRQIKRMIDKSALDEAVKDISLKIFRTIAEAEAKAHDTTVDDVHFHEIGALDSIIDIVGTAIGFCRLGIERFESSPIPVASGFVKTSHGVMPIPAPATMYILKNVPLYGGNAGFELTTPTGAAIISALCSVAKNSIPPMKPLKVGYGAGRKTREDGVPNFLRLIIGETPLANVKVKELTVIETNLDDITPEALSYAMKKILSSGALDVWVVPTIMKKGRQAFCLSVLCENFRAADFRRAVLEETPTLGVREYRVERYELDRKIIKVKTDYGMVRVKRAITPSGKIRLKPEFDDVSKLAEKTGATFEDVYQATCVAANRRTR